MSRRRISVVVVGSIVVGAVLLALHLLADRLPERRSVDPLTLLYSGSRFPGVGDYAHMTVEMPAHLSRRGQGGNPTVVKIWDGSAPRVRQLVTMNHNANDAAEFFREWDPRITSLDDRARDRVGPSRPRAVPGFPDKSQVHCSKLNSDDRRHCDYWVWWARYGQYVVELYVGGGPNEYNVDRQQFEKIVDLAATQIGKKLGPPQ